MHSKVDFVPAFYFKPCNWPGSQAAVFHLGMYGIWVCFANENENEKWQVVTERTTKGQKCVIIKQNMI